MAGMKWTGEQWEAITEKDCNLLVAAAAGAGKTAVLVERIIRIITHPKSPVDIDQMLIVTFTNAAAAEMRERIAAAILEILDQQPHNKNIQRQLTLLNKANIMTIHSFCLEVVRRHFQLVDLDPGFRIADATEASLIQLEALEELFEDQYELEEVPRDFLNLLESYSGNRDDQTLQNIVLEIYNFVQSSPWPEKWLQEMAASFKVPEDTDFSDTPWGRVLLDSVAVGLQGLRTQMERAISLLNEDSGLEKYRDTFVEDVAALDVLLQLCSPETQSENQSDNFPSRSWDAICEALEGYSFSRLPSIRKADNPDKMKQDYVKNIRDAVKKEINRIRETIFTATSSEIIEELACLEPMMQYLAVLVADFGSRYRAKKGKKALLDFNDLEHLCLKILVGDDKEGNMMPSEVALGYRERFAEILVDEYQDSNLVQEMILTTISREATGTPNMFMVGDVKQSIYRFRQARPELFLEKYHQYSPDKGQPFRKILLFKNFRSRKEVVDAVNFLFKQIMSYHVGELEYSDVEALNPGAQYPEPEEGQVLLGGGVELHLLQTGQGANHPGVGEAGENFSDSSNYADSSESMEAYPESDIFGDDVGGVWPKPGEAAVLEAEPLDNIQCEARLVARCIQELMQPVAVTVQDAGFVSPRYIFDKERKAYRRLEFRDIVILLRTTKKWSEVFMEELKLQGIPAFADTGSGFFATSEVQVILSLLQLIDNPLQDIPLLAVLRSPIVNFSTEELAEVRLADRKAPLFQALVLLAKQDSGQTSKKAANFLADLERWRDMSQYMSTDQLLWQLYSETGYYSMVGAMPAGEQRQANLRILFQRARQFETTSYKGLFNFIFFVDRLKTSHGDMGSAKILGENDNVVRIMSIHKSKGLEFPVVILSGCGKKFNLQDMNRSIVLHQDLGLGPDVVDFRRRLVHPSAPKQAIREKVKIETLSEEMRLLYVAMTRARERLIITGTLKDVEKAAEQWAHSAQAHGPKLPGYVIQQGNSFLDWLGPSLLRHQDVEALRETAQVSHRFEGYLLEDDSEWNLRVWDKNQLLTELRAGQEESAPFRWLEEAGAALEESQVYGSDADGEVHESGADTEAREIGTHGEVSSGSGHSPGFSEERVPCAGYENSDLAGEVDRRLSWQYPYAKAFQVPVKVSVTELKRQFEAEFSHEGETVPAEYLQGPLRLIKRPGFLETKQGLTSAEAGTAMHFVMQHLDFTLEKDSIEAQVAAMVTKAMLTQEQANSVDVEKIKEFLSSPLGQRLRASKNVNREVPFNLSLPCQELFEDMQGDEYQGETVLLQGVIDCYFEEEDGIVLLDYKTDYVPPGAEEKIKERYRLQISYYSRALETLTGKSVKDKYIYLFYNGEVLEY